MAQFIIQEATRRTGAKTLTISGTATGSSTDVIRYGSGGYATFGVLAVLQNSTQGTTGNFRVRGSINSTSIWTNLMAADNPTTGGVVVNTTAGLVVDRISITTTSNSMGSTEASPVLSVTIVPLVGG